MFISKLVQLNSYPNNGMLKNTNYFLNSSNFFTLFGILSSHFVGILKE
ncbi:hypothetical protein CMALT394_210021 [Carnobacterium maltaromaticum]|nr:hypothetical protein CMALT394_210021 [Carnobacterium maltaromaticum]